MTTTKMASPAMQKFVLSLSEQVGAEKPDVEHMSMSAAHDKIEALKGLRLEMWKAKDAVAMADVAPWEAGSAHLALTVQVAKVKESMYGLTNKVLGRDDLGRHIWMTLPKAAGDYLEEELAGLKGWQFEVDVTVDPSDDDSHFAFGSRPHGFVWTSKSPITVHE